MRARPAAPYRRNTWASSRQRAASAAGVGGDCGAIIGVRVWRHTRAAHQGRGLLLYRTAQARRPFYGGHTARPLLILPRTCQRETFSQAARGGASLTKPPAGWISGGRRCPLWCPLVEQVVRFGGWGCAGCARTPSVFAVFRATCPPRVSLRNLRGFPLLLRRRGGFSRSRAKRPNRVRTFVPRTLVPSLPAYSHSIVAGGLEEMS